MQAQEQKDTSKEQLRSTCNRIAQEIENGIEITADNIDEWNDDGQYEIGDYVSGFDLIKDALDIEYRVDSKKEYLGAEVMVAFGGPNIWIDTKNQKVCGAWWGDYYEARYMADAMGIDDACSEIFNCI